MDETTSQTKGSRKSRTAYRSFRFLPLASKQKLAIGRFGAKV